MRMTALPEPIEPIYHADRPWWTLIGLYRPQRRWVVLAVIAYLFKASPLWILPVVTANIIDIMAHREPGGAKALLVNAIIGTIAILQNVGSAACYVNFLSRAVRNVEIRLRSALIRRLQMLSIGYHSRVNTGALQTKVLRDVESIEQMSRQLVDIGVLAIVSIAVAVAVTLWRMPVFSLVFVAFVPIVILIRRVFAGGLQRRNELVRRQLESMNSLVQGMIDMIPITRAHAAEDEEIARVESQFDHVRSAARSFDHYAGIFGAAAWVLLMLIGFLVPAVAAWLTYKGVLALTPGNIFLLFTYFGTIMTAVMQLNAMLPVVTRGFDGLRSIGEVLECPDTEENRGKRALSSVRGEFCFEDVSFRYDPDSSGTAALRDISLHVATGETIGIAGPSGSGKSTLAGLITGFHRPTSGRILLDGADMNTIDLRTFRRHLSVVSQQTILFNGTLRENIIYGTRKVSESALWEAIEAANAAEFIARLPHGLETRLGQGGMQLSGGQRQRLAIARALLRNPRVLILDEATSSLDTEGQALVQEALDRLAEGRTTFIIAHRLDTLLNADRVIVLDKGEVVKFETPTKREG